MLHVKCILGSGGGRVAKESLNGSEPTLSPQRPIAHSADSDTLTYISSVTGNASCHSHKSKDIASESMSKSRASVKCVQCLPSGISALLQPSSVWLRDLPRRQPRSLPDCRNLIPLQCFGVAPTAADIAQLQICIGELYSTRKRGLLLLHRVVVTGQHRLCRSHSCGMHNASYTAAKQGIEPR